MSIVAAPCAVSRSSVRDGPQATRFCFVSETLQKDHESPAETIRVHVESGSCRRTSRSRILERDLPQSHRTACGELGRLMTRAAARQIDPDASHSRPSVPHSHCPRPQAPFLHFHIFRIPDMERESGHSSTISCARPLTHLAIPATWKRSHPERGSAATGAGQIHSDPPVLAHRRVQEPR